MHVVLGEETLSFIKVPPSILQTSYGHSFCLTACLKTYLTQFVLVLASHARWPLVIINQPCRLDHSMNQLIRTAINQNI